MAERKVPCTISQEYAFEGTQLNALLEAQRVGKRDFDSHKYLEVDLTSGPSDPVTGVADWVITIRNGMDGYLKVPTDHPVPPAPGARPDPYQSDGNEYDGV